MAVYAKVVDSASFAAAARHFGMSPAMVSKHIQTLEDRLGVRLLNRTTRRVSPTEAGQDYYERAVRILADMEDAEAVAGDMQTSPRGQLRVTAPTSFGTHRLAPAVADYLVKYPDVSIDLSLDNPYVDLVDKRFDLGIRFGHLESSSLIARKLYTLETYLCASPAYLAKKSAPRHPADLAKHRCLVYNGPGGQKLWHFVDRDGKEEIAHVSGRFQANSGDVLVPPALNGCGLLMAPDYLLEDHLKAGRLVRVMLDYRTQETPVYAVYPSRNPSAKTRTFIDFLTARFGRANQTDHGDMDDATLPPPDVLVARATAAKERRAS
ncbi:MAG TPA: LysR family transcriptional regulator [Xanthobacteraceae bacterium]|jgi:DNA-binding transcriptional LysR family regulator|nr:LysR family transcriptional regulator [Xanthobacteraceae bacterium]